MKVADIDDLQDVGRLTHERDPQKYPYTHLTSLTTANYVAGNPLYDILHDGRTSFEGPPLLSLKSTGWGQKPIEGTAVAEWHVDMPAFLSSAYTFALAQLTVFDGALPNLQDGNCMFYRSGLTSWDVELPSLTSANWMFRSSKLTEWHIDLPSLTGSVSYFAPTTLQSFRGDLSNLKDGTGMFSYSSVSFTSFSSALPSLTNGERMFTTSKLDLPSVQCIASTIKNNNDMATPPTLTLGMAKALKGQVDAELDLIRAKGWNLTPKYN